MEITDDVAIHVINLLDETGPWGRNILLKWLLRSLPYYLHKIPFFDVTLFLNIDIPRQWILYRSYLMRLILVLNPLTSLSVLYSFHFLLSLISLSLFLSLVCIYIHIYTSVHPHIDIENT